VRKFFIITTLCGVFITLIALGTWQVQRLSWKNSIIQQLEAVYAQDSSKNIFSFNDLNIRDDEVPILYGTIKGSFYYDKEILVGPRPFEGEIGYYVITPLKIDKGHVFVHRGFIRVDNKDQISETHKNRSVRVSGLFRKPDWNRFTPDNSPENDIWTKLDLDQIAEAKSIETYAPVLLYAEEISASHPLLKLQQGRWIPRNKHRQYAIFWFSMAIIFAVLIFIYVRKSKI
jgi:surfeit locus 1 family protein